MTRYTTNAGPASAAAVLPEDARRFEFGKNWSRFLSLLDEDRIRAAEQSLTTMLGIDSMRGRSFLDIGSGSGLFSLAAFRLGATVRSFDFDAQSVACTRELRQRVGADEGRWIVECASILDTDFVRSLGEYDIIYSWGVLHHTGAMWKALENAQIPLRAGGSLFVSIYNYQRPWSSFYHRIKKLYVSSPKPARALIAGMYVAEQVGKGVLKDVLLLRNPLARYRARKSARGMSMLRDWVDWIGGYPFEVARPEEIVQFYRKYDLYLERMTTCGSGQGCNEFVFVRLPRSGGQRPGRDAGGSVPQR